MLYNQVQYKQATDMITSRPPLDSGCSRSHGPTSSDSSKSPFYLYKFNNSSERKLDDYKIFPTPSCSPNTTSYDNKKGYTYTTSGSMLCISTEQVNNLRHNPLDNIKPQPPSCTNPNLGNVVLPPISSIAHLNETPSSPNSGATEAPSLRSPSSATTPLLPLLKATSISSWNTSPILNDNNSETFSPFGSGSYSSQSSTSDSELKKDSQNDSSDDSDSYVDHQDHDSKSDIKRQIFKCAYPECKYRGTFLSKDYLRRHIREQHRGSKGHVCKGRNADGSSWGCSKKFNRPYQLVNHWKGQRSLKRCGVPKSELAKFDIV